MFSQAHFLAKDKKNSVQFSRANNHIHESFVNHPSSSFFEKENKKFKNFQTQKELSLENSENQNLSPNIRVLRASDQYHEENEQKSKIAKQNDISSENDNTELSGSEEKLFEVFGIENPVLFHSSHNFSSKRSEIKSIEAEAFNRPVEEEESQKDLHFDQFERLKCSSQVFCPNLSNKEKGQSILTKSQVTRSLEAFPSLLSKLTKSGKNNSKFASPSTKKKSNPVFGPTTQNAKAYNWTHFSRNQREEAYFINRQKIESVGKTALNIKNIPNKYSSEMLLELIDANFKDKYDFFYLPMDTYKNCNLGFAFINLTSIKFVEPFLDEFEGRKWPKFNSEKICEIRYARLQNQKNLKEQFKLPLCSQGEFSTGDYQVKK